MFHLLFVGRTRLDGRPAGDVPINMEAADTSEDGAIVVGMAYFVVSPNVRVNFPIDRPYVWDQVRGSRPLFDVLRFNAGLDATGKLVDGWLLSDVSEISADVTTVVGTGIN